MRRTWRTRHRVPGWRAAFAAAVGTAQSGPEKTRHRDNERSHLMPGSRDELGSVNMGGSGEVNGNRWADRAREWRSPLAITAGRISCVRRPQWLCDLAPAVQSPRPGQRDSAHAVRIGVSNSLWLVSGASLASLLARSDESQPAIGICGRRGHHPLRDLRRRPYLAGGGENEDQLCLGHRAYHHHPSGSGLLPAAHSSDCFTRSQGTAESCSGRDAGNGRRVRQGSPGLYPGMCRGRGHRNVRLYAGPPAQPVSR